MTIAQNSIKLYAEFVKIIQLFYLFFQFSKQHIVLETMHIACGIQIKIKATVTPTNCKINDTVSTIVKFFHQTSDSVSTCSSPFVSSGSFIISFTVMEASLIRSKTLKLVSTNLVLIFRRAEIYLRVVLHCRSSSKPCIFSRCHSEDVILFINRLSLITALSFQLFGT